MCSCSVEVVGIVEIMVAERLAASEIQIRRVGKHPDKIPDMLVGVLHLCVELRLSVRFAQWGGDEHKLDASTCTIGADFVQMFHAVWGFLERFISVVQGPFSTVVPWLLT